MRREPHKDHALSSKEAPMLSGAKVGSKITMLVKATVKGVSSRHNSGSDKSEECTLEINKIGVASTNN